MPTISTIEEGLAYGLWESGERGSMPWPPPPAIKRAANDLKKLYEVLNGVSVQALMKREGAHDAGDFGDRLARAALGEVLEEQYRVRRSASGRKLPTVTLPAGRPHFESAIKIPRFEFSYKGNELTWSGEAVERNPTAEDDLESDLGINPPEQRKAAARAEAVLRARREAGMEPCAEGCPGWALFETDRGYGIQRCDECNTIAKREGLPQLLDRDAKWLPAAQRIFHRAVRDRGREERGEDNPSRFTDKGERMYEEIKKRYEDEGEPRAAEIAARTVYARSRELPGLLKVGMGRPPGVPNRGR